jgi:hypothetical protein
MFDVEEEEEEEEEELTSSLSFWEFLLSLLDDTVSSS